VDTRDIEEEGKDREAGGWGIGIIFFTFVGIVI
jgi:hypothetical protein